MKTLTKLFVWAVLGAFAGSGSLFAAATLPAPNRAAALEKKFIGAPEPLKAQHASPLTPELEQAAFTLPPGFEIELVAAESEDIGKFVTVEWDLHGRMWSMTALEYPVDANESPAVAQALYASAGKDKVIVWETPFAPGPQKGRIFAEGLAIPLGLLPYKNGAYVQHGGEIVFLSDQNSDGQADRREVILTGFGVQDSHLFPHQFTRAPGNWIWFAQGAFNYGKVKTTRGAEQQFDRTRMARFRYDGSEFDITSQGPCNIWGLVLNGEGECFIQEANDYGYPVMPFHAYANYPGCSDVLFKSYAPEFPGTAPDFRMGGTGLSGLALSDARGAWPEPYADVMYVANPITRKIQAIKIHRDGPRYRLEKLADFVQSSDPMFRPVALRTGPDGCLYIVDWYNIIISHNEVPRTHPDRDKKRGRIWRVKHREQKPFPVPDFTKLSADELLAKLGGASLAQSHLAWQAIEDRQLKGLGPKLKALVTDKNLPAAKRIASLWALEALGLVQGSVLTPLFQDANRNVRREAVRAMGQVPLPSGEVLAALQSLTEDPDPEVRAEVIRAIGPLAGKNPRAVALCIKMARPSIAEPSGTSTQSGKIIKVGIAYEREFERYLVRLFLEQQPQAVAAFLDSAQARTLPVENRLLATLAIDPRLSAARLAQLLPDLNRAPGDEEILRLAEFVDEPGVRNALGRILENAMGRTAVLTALLKVRNRLDAAKLGPLLESPAGRLLSGTNSGVELGLRVVSSFKLHGLEDEIDSLLTSGKLSSPALKASALRALRELTAGRVETLAALAKDPDRTIGQEAILALAASKNEQAAPLLLGLWPDLTAPQRRTTLDRLADTPLGARSIIQGVESGAIGKLDLASATLDKMSTVLPEDASLAALIRELADLFRPVLYLNGAEDAWVDSNITLEGPFTVETWVNLEPGISNESGILGSPGIVDMNFHEAKFRVWVSGLHDAIIARKSIAPDSWTHIAVTRGLEGRFRIYLNGELDTDQSQAAPQKFDHCRIGWTAPNKGTAGRLTEYRVWNRVCSPDEIRANFDRSLEGETKPSGLVYYFSGAAPAGVKLRGSAQIEKTRDFPPLLTASQARAQAEKFAKFRALAEKPGDTHHGQALFTNLCVACHTAGGSGGGHIGPILSGAGAMGAETLLRAILTPNAAMEAGYRLFRVELRDGDLADGILVSQNENAILLRRPNSEDLRIAQKEVKRAGYTKMSMMPEGLLESLRPEEVTDLFAYLKTLK